MLNKDTISSVEDGKAFQQSESKEFVTIVGFGSLLSKQSALTTTPSLRNYHYVRVQNYRRLFQHPAAIFFERGEFPGIAIPETKEIASLSTEPASGFSFLACAYEIPRDEWTSLAAREEEFQFVETSFTMFDESADKVFPNNTGYMCTQSTDEALKQTSLWQRYENYLEPSYGHTTVWHWPKDSGLKPCPVYCRHCVLAVSDNKAPEAVHKSFLDDTYLVDRVTTLRQYLSSNSHVMESIPPAEFAARYSG